MSTLTMESLKAGSVSEKVLARAHFAVTAELGPPKSADASLIASKAKLLAGNIDAANITDNQTAIVRMSSIAAGLLALREGIEPIIQITCRDRNRIAIQSDVLGASALGIRNILCLTGDHQKFGNHPTSKNVFDMDSIQLIGMLACMRDQKRFACGDEIRNSKKAPIVEPRILIGGAENPFGDPLEFRAIRVAKKVDAGVDFIQTQCIYDMERFEEFMRQVRARGLHEKVKILAGVTPLKSVGMAKYMRDSVAGLSVPDSIIQRLEKAADKAARGHPDLHRADPAAARDPGRGGRPHHGHRMGREGGRDREGRGPAAPAHGGVRSDMKGISIGKLDPRFAGEIASAPGGKNIRKCYACGTCTAGCPVFQVDADYNPRKLIRMILLGMRKEVLSSKAIWLCARCYACTANCPQAVDFSDIMMVLRDMAVAEGPLPWTRWRRSTPSAPRRTSCGGTASTSSSGSGETTVEDVRARMERALALAGKA